MTDVTIRSLYSNERVITKAHVRGDRLYVTLHGMRAALRRLQARDGSREAMRGKPVAFAQALALGYLVRLTQGGGRA